ncbi:unnamed protein product [Mytilus coruscus]|uniref:C-type lectin domain-containing protein n=1 Tax=Mytilus coruscus TaxID=42192 RepID=A0A6J8C8K0_MYTCO|nr:unnamed protein product [Mytilus coruscus]
MRNIMVTTKGVEKILKMLMSKAMGPDGIHPRVLKELAPNISEVMGSLSNNPSTEEPSHRNGKSANICPLFKKKRQNHPKTLGLLKRNLSACPLEVKLQAYKGLIRPVLEYASTAWDPHQIYLQDQLANVQKRATRFITSNYNYEPGKDNLVKATGESLKDSLCKGAGYNMSDTGIMCYQIENRKQNYVTASRQCVNESGHLVRVDSTEKFDDIEAVVLGEEAGFRILVDGRYSSGGVWKFSDGSLMTILDFVLDQPDSSMQDDKDSSKQNEEDSSNEDNEDCIVLVYNSGMVRMDHVSCNEQFTFICEIELL